MPKSTPKHTFTLSSQIATSLFKVIQITIIAIYINTLQLNNKKTGLVVNKTWYGMEKVNKTQNGTAESAQSTPTHPWLTELHPHKLFVHTLACLAGNIWEADYSILAHNYLPAHGMHGLQNSIIFN